MYLIHFELICNFSFKVKKNILRICTLKFHTILDDTKHCLNDKKLTLPCKISNREYTHDVGDEESIKDLCKITFSMNKNSDDADATSDDLK